MHLIAIVLVGFGIGTLLGVFLTEEDSQRWQALLVALGLLVVDVLLIGQWI